MNPRTLPVLSALIVATLAGAADAQERDGAAVVTPPGGQVASDRGTNLTTIGQITPQTPARDSVDQVDPVRRTSQTTQVGGAQRAPAADPHQLTTGPRTTTAPAQLAPQGRTAAAPESSARKADGRQTAIVRIAGSDRCDPQAEKAKDANCAAVIETRAAQFQGSRVPTLSPEQRLLLTQDPSELQGVRAATQRIGRNSVDADALDTQAIASVSLGRAAEPAPPTPPIDPKMTPAAQAILQIIDAAQAMAPK